MIVDILYDTLIFVLRMVTQQVLVSVNLLASALVGLLTLVLVECIYVVVYL